MYPGEDVVCMCGSLFSCCFAFSHCHVGYVVIFVQHSHLSWKRQPGYFKLRDIP